MAAKDLKAASIDATGKYLTLTHDTMHVTGFGYSPDALNALAADGGRQLTQYSTAKIVLTVTKPGFTTVAGATTYNYAVYGTMVRYKEAPPANSYAPDAANSGADLVTVWLLSDEVQDTDTAIVSVAAGAVFDDGGNCNAAVGFTVDVTACNLAYGKSEVQWSCVPRQQIEPGALLTLRVVARHPYGIARVRFTVSDTHSHTVTADVTATVSAQGSFAVHPVMGQVKYRVYEAAIATTSFTTGDILSCDVEVHPLVGDAGAVESSAGVGYPSMTLCTWPMWLQPRGGVAVVDTVAGSDVSGIASTYALRSTAAALPFATWGAALAAIKAFNLLTYSYNHLGGSTLFLKAGNQTYQTLGGTHTATNANLIITPYDGVARTAVPITAPIDLTNSATNRNLHLKGLNFRPVAAGAAQSFNGGLNVLDVCTVEDCDFLSPDSTNGTAWQNNDGFTIYFNVKVKDYKDSIRSSGAANRCLINHGSYIENCGVYAVKEHKSVAGCVGVNCFMWFQEIDATRSNFINCWNVFEVVDEKMWGIDNVVCNRVSIEHNIGYRKVTVGGTTGAEISSVDRDDLTFRWNTAAGPVPDAANSVRINIEPIITDNTTEVLGRRVSIRGNITTSINTRQHSGASLQQKVNWRGPEYSVNGGFNIQQAPVIRSYYDGIGEQISVDPLFTNKAGLDFSLQAGSPARAAVPAAFIPPDEWDAFGNPMVAGSAIGGWQPPAAAVPAGDAGRSMMSMMFGE